MKNTASGIRILIALALCAMLVPTAFAEDLEAIKIELPEASFLGTPIAYFSANLEPYDYKDRPPFMAPKGTSVISRDKAVTASAKPTVGTLTRLTDGDKGFSNTSLVELPAGLQWAQIDLEKSSQVYAVLLWHFHAGNRVYFDVVVQLSDDPEFKKEVTTVYNNDLDDSAGLGVGKDNEYYESNKGRLMDAKGAKGRYLRVYGQGSTENDFNNLIEVEVWGKKIE